MKFKKGDHLQEIDSIHHGYVINFGSGIEINFNNSIDENWYLLNSDEIELVNHWVPEGKLELHKQPLRDFKLEKLGIK